MNKLILMRHGESEWNKRNLFTGWVDVPLSEKGIEEAIEAGKSIQDMPVDIIITTTLIRAQMTALLAMAHHSSGNVPIIIHDEGKHADWSQIYCEAQKENTIPVIRTCELNERMYGELQGLNKADTAKKFGADQVKIWRRSYDTPPPRGESLKMTAERSIPYFEKKIVPLLKEGYNVLVSAHGNSLRSIIMKLDNLSKEEVLSLEVPTGKPIIYSYEDGNFTR